MYHFLPSILLATQGKLAIKVGLILLQLLFGSFIYKSSLAVPILLLHDD
jgi:hypothetical protein